MATLPPNVAQFLDGLEGLLGAVRDRLPSSLHGDGGMLVHLLNTVQSTSVSGSKGNGKLILTGLPQSIAEVDCDGVVGVPVGATKALLQPTVNVHVNDRGLEADTSDYLLLATSEWGYDGTSLEDIRILSEEPGSLYVWFYD